MDGWPKEKGNLGRSTTFAEGRPWQKDNHGGRTNFAKLWLAEGPTWLKRDLDRRKTLTKGRPWQNDKHWLIYYSDGRKTMKKGQIWQMTTMTEEGPCGRTTTREIQPWQKHNHDGRTILTEWQRIPRCFFRLPAGMFEPGPEQLPGHWEGSLGGCKGQAWGHSLHVAHPGPSH